MARLFTPIGFKTGLNSIKHSEEETPFPLTLLHDLTNTAHGKDLLLQSKAAAKRSSSGSYQ